LLEALQKRPYVIITTGYQEYSLKAYELNVQDYLLKPYTFDRFVRAVNRIYDLMFVAHSRANPGVGSGQAVAIKDYFFVRNNYKMLKVRFCDIQYIQGLSNYLIIKTNNEAVFTLQGFREILSLLPSDRFMRVHRSYVVALDKIDYIQKNKIKIGDQMIPIGESYKQIFMEHLRRYHLI
jgi:DNA-binding LytR/AlgR family response regulator